ncbi:MAG: hypothetical protein AAF490_10985 [Chloroflexota bacterium]
MILKRRHSYFLLFLFILTACGAPRTAVSPIQTQPDPITQAPETAVSPIEQSTEAIPTLITPTEPPPATVTPSPVPSDLSIDASQVFLYPTPIIYDGDRVTFQLLAHVPDTIRAENVQVQIWVNNELLVQDILGRRNLANNAVGLYEWVWDTTDKIGEHQVSILLDPNDSIQQGDENPANNQVLLTTYVEDSNLLSEGEQNATWVTAETNCCTVHVVSETAAFRDLSNLLIEVENAFQNASATLDEPANKKYDVFLVDRVIGQGGYAGQSMVVSYLDRHYASNGLEQVLIHEAVHLLDRQFAPGRITFLAEGVAVWASGGHYKPENIEQRAAALVSTDRYIPLQALIDNFYPVQHEIGYLEAAGFVNYLIKIYGWNQFKTFYANVTRDDGATLSEAMDVNLQASFGITLAQAEANWLDYLSQLPFNPDMNSDLLTSIRFYDTMRTYQRFYDPTAYFLTAWLPYPQELQSSGNPADLTRHPSAEINVTLEVMLQAAELALRTGDFARANAHLDSIERVLTHNGTFIDPLSISYLNVVRAATAQGFAVQTINLSGNSASVLANRPGTIELTELNFSLNGSEWVLSN